VVTQEFFDRLDMLLPERTADGGPSAKDFLEFELPEIVDKLAYGYERFTFLRPSAPHRRVFSFESVLLGAMALVVALTDEDVVEVQWPLIYDPPG
jgi:hypothetical protein